MEEKGIEDFPDEIIVKIIDEMENLSMKDIRRIRAASPAVRRISNDRRFWDRLFIRKYLDPLRARLMVFVPRHARQDEIERRRRRFSTSVDEMFGEWKSERFDGMDEFLHYVTWMAWTSTRRIELVKDGMSVAVIHVDTPIGNPIGHPVGLYVDFSDAGFRLMTSTFPGVNLLPYNGNKLYQYPGATFAMARRLIYNALMDGWGIFNKASKERALGAQYCLECIIKPSMHRLEGRSETFCSMECAKTWWNANPV